MRHNQNNNRRFRGNHGGQQRHNNHGNHGGGGHGNNGQRRVNPRVQTFDSNGPDVRIRGNAIQITEKYLTLARDATAAGDRILAESYFQHAEHYQRMLNEANEEFARNNPQAAQQQQQQQQQGADAEVQPQQQPGVDGTGEQPVVALNDLDQGFLVGNRQQPQAAQPSQAVEGEAQPQAPQPRAAQQGGRGGNQRRAPNPPKEVESA